MQNPSNFPSQPVSQYPGQFPAQNSNDFVNDLLKNFPPIPKKQTWTYSF